MDVKAINEFLTPDRLVDARWTWSNQYGEELTKSFYFGEDGRIKVFKCPNEHSWTLELGILRIFDEDGVLFWLFDVVIQSQDGLAMVARCQKYHDWPWFCLTEYKKTGFIKAEIDLSPEAAEPAKDEGVRLVIWDLDETFWRGTLTEGGITTIQANIEIVETLNRRGIVSAICSKNDFAEVQRLLAELGLWESFVFPQIAFAPKGKMIETIVKNIQLRPETVMFIDDNKMNLNEALHYVPKLQTAEPDFLPALLEDKRFAGKPDLEKTRLARYKILESKLTEQASGGGDNETFLRASDIRISFHTDIEAQFPRIHDLVNRTNQLNFTKNRWPEDEEAAKNQYVWEQSKFGAHAGYVKVADRYGAYGIAGFYNFAFGEAWHFLFSCRTMNMGVEQFVWKKIGRPHIAVNGEVASDVDMDVDWITVVDDADDAAAVALPGARQTVCIRGACELMMVSQFLRTRVTTIEEFNFAYEGWGVCSTPRAVALHEEAQTPENRAIIARLPGFPPNRFESDIVTGAADIYILSFSQETFCGHYRAKSTGMVLPLQHLTLWHYGIERQDFTAVPYDEVERRGAAGITEAQWDFLRNEFEFAGGFDAARFQQDVTGIFTLLKSRDKRVIILGLNDKIGQDKELLEFFGNINRIVRPIANSFGAAYLDITQFLHSLDDLGTDGVGGAHLGRHVYAQVAEAIFKLLPKAEEQVPDRAAA